MSTGLTPPPKCLSWGKPLKALAFLLAVIMLYYLYSVFAQTSLATPDQVREALAALVNVASFVTAGWTAGFTFFLGSMIKESKKMIEEANRLSMSAEEALGKQSQGLQKEGKQVLSTIKDEADALSRGLPAAVQTVFVSGIVAFLALVLSALVAVSGLLKAESLLVFWSFGFLEFGVLITIITWLAARDSTEYLAEAAQQIASTRRLMDKTSAESSALAEEERRYSSGRT